MSETVLAVIQLDNFPQHVANRAAWIARLFGYDLHLLLSDPSLAVLRDSFIVSNEAKEIARSIETAQQQLLDDLKNAVSENGEIQVTTTITHDRPAHDAIIAQALEIEPKVVVKGTQYHSPAERATFAYTDWQLIRKLNAPLWFVKPNDWKDAPVLVAAVDPTHRHDKAGTLDQKIIDFGKSIASKCGGHLILLHTYQRLVEIGTYAKFKFKPVKLPIDELDKNIRAEHRQKLDAAALPNGFWTTCTATYLSRGAIKPLDKVAHTTSTIATARKTTCRSRHDRA
jgi:nucleotide-binding universal stress UspA family protein